MKCNPDCTNCYEDFHEHSDLSINTRVEILRDSNAESTASTTAPDGDFCSELGEKVHGRYHCPRQSVVGTKKGFSLVKNRYSHCKNEDVHVKGSGQDKVKSKSSTKRITCFSMEAKINLDVKGYPERIVCEQHGLDAPVKNNRVRTDLSQQASYRSDRRVKEEKVVSQRRGFAATLMSHIVNVRKMRHGMRIIGSLPIQSTSPSKLSAINNHVNVSQTSHKSSTSSITSSYNLDADPPALSSDQYPNHEHPMPAQSESRRGKSPSKSNEEFPQPGKLSSIDIELGETLAPCCSKKSLGVRFQHDDEGKQAITSSLHAESLDQDKNDNALQCLRPNNVGDALPPVKTNEKSCLQVLTHEIDCESHASVKLGRDQARHEFVRPVDVAVENSLSLLGQIELGRCSPTDTYLGESILESIQDEAVSADVCDMNFATDDVLKLSDYTEDSLTNIGTATQKASILLVDRQILINLPESTEFVPVARTISRVDEEEEVSMSSSTTESTRSATCFYETQPVKRVETLRNSRKDRHVSSILERKLVKNDVLLAKNGAMANISNTESSDFMIHGDQRRNDDMRYSTVNPKKKNQLACFLERYVDKEYAPSARSVSTSSVPTMAGSDCERGFHDSRRDDRLQSMLNPQKMNHLALHLERHIADNDGPLSINRSTMSVSTTESSDCEVSSYDTRKEDKGETAIKRNILQSYLEKRFEVDDTPIASDFLEGHNVDDMSRSTAGSSGNFGVSIYDSLYNETKEVRRFFI